MAVVFLAFMSVGFIAVQLVFCDIHLESKPIVKPWWVMAVEETLTSMCPSIIPSQLFLPRMLLYCRSHTARHHLKCARVWQSCWGCGGSPTLDAVTIHPWMDLTVHWSHVQSLAWRLEIRGNVPGEPVRIKRSQWAFCLVRFSLKWIITTFSFFCFTYKKLNEIYIFQNWSLDKWV